MLREKPRVYVYYFLIFILSLGLFYSFNQLTATQSSNYLYREKCVLCLISSFFNIFVLYYHYAHAPHPKYLMLARRRFVIYTHIISGVLEFTTCWIAFLTGSTKIGTLAALVAILGHVPSAYYHVSIAFGAKAMTVAGYLFCISLHLFCAVRLFNEPDSVYWLLNMFLVHNVYVWCRVFYFFFSFVGIFTDTLYTNTVLTSCLILFPAVLGVSANMLLLGYVASSILLYFFIVQPDKEERIRFVSERTRDLLVDTTVHNAWIKEKARLVTMADETHLNDREQAKQVFDQLDENKNGTLDSDEIAQLLKEWKTAEGFMKRFCSLSSKGDVSFDVFYKTIWRLGQTSLGQQRKGELKQGTAKARFIFDHLDYDHNGYIDIIELQKLLIQWGLPDDEVDDYLAYDDDKRFSFDEFVQNLKPIWEFAFENMTSRHTNDVITPRDHSD